MSNTNINGGPAFPEIRIRSGDNYNPTTKFYYGGMTLRDYFAAKAMQGATTGDGGLPDSSYCQQIARRAYEMADAMLKARGGSK